MKNQAILPTPGGVLRTLITASGYRPLFEKVGLDKDLDDQATENRQGRNFDLLERCQEQWFSAIREDAGVEWSSLIESAWNRHSNLLRSLARNTDTTNLLSERARPVVLRLLVITEISGAIRRVSQELPLLDINQWWNAPFYYWLKAASLQSKTPEKQLLERLANHLDLDERSLERWLKGASMGKGLWPYRETMKTLFAGSHLVARQAERLTGWLVMVVALQSLSAELRDSVKHDFVMQRQQSLRTEQQFIACLNAEAANRQSLSECGQVAPVLNDLKHLFADAVGNQQLIRDRLDWLGALCERGSATTRAAHEHLWLGLSARLAANLGEKEPALKLYAAACQMAWWRAGPCQHEFIHEALCYAVGVGDQIQANHFWDRCFLLGLNNAPKRTLDKQEMRRIAFEFERLFPSQKPSQKIPPGMRFELMEKPFALSSRDRESPNALCKHADGRVRYTPLMNAVLRGELEHVMTLVQAGGDPNVYIPESGENALIMALRRAEDRKHPAILQYLLTLNISPETANRPASTKRETPLHIAMNMGDANVVERLIELGADVEQACFNSPSALVYAMALLNDSIHADDPAQLKAYLEGRVPADAFDARNGAILDCELPAQRLGVYAMRSDPQLKMIFEAVAQHYNKLADERRKVIMTLLAKGADPNRRYPDFNGHRDAWTPTLFAAQVGDLDVLKAMIEAGGNPWLSLEQDHPVAEKNALWVAVIYKRQCVIEYLLALLPERATP